MAAGNSPTFRDQRGADQRAQERFIQAAPVTRPLNDGLNGRVHAAAAIKDAGAQTPPAAAEDHVLEGRGTQPQNEVIAMDGKRDYTGGEDWSNTGFEERSKASTLTDAQKSRIKALDNTINDHLTDGDFSGTLRDLQGNPVPNG